MTHNLKVVWNAVPMFLELDGETGWRVRESWPKAGMGSPVIVMREPGVVRKNSCSRGFQLIFMM